MWKAIQDLLVCAAILVVLAVVLGFAVEQRRLATEATGHERGNALILSASIGDLDGIREAVSQSIPIDYRDRWGMTPLMMAVSCRQEAALQLLLKLGADVDASTGGALRIAVRQDDTTFVRLLLDAGADASRCDLQAVHSPEVVALLQRAQVRQAWLNNRITDHRM